MNKKSLENMINLTHACINRCWKKDIEFLFNYMDENITWIGALQNQFVKGKENLTNIIKKLHEEMKPCSLVNQHFYAAHNSGTSCTVVGRYIVIPDEGMNISFQIMQRCTYVWELKKGVPRIVCIHISCPVGQIKVDRNEIFPNELGNMAYKYIINEIEKVKKGKKALPFYDIKGALRFIYMDDVEFAESNKRTVIIHTVYETIEVKLKWSEFLDIPENKLLLVHRNYTINKDFVVLVNSNSIKMKSGTIIPIPTKKSIAIKIKLVKLLEDIAD